MSKFDLKKELKYLYQPSPKEVVLVDVPRMNFLMIDGQGDPNTSQEFQEAADALYSVSYGIKFALKQQNIGPEYTVMPLEGLWWVAGGGDFDMDARDAWCWTLMIMQPDHITREVVERATGPQRIVNCQLSIVNTFAHQANDSPFPLPYIPAAPSPSG